MASHNVVFAIDVNCGSGLLGVGRDAYRTCVKQWLLRTLLSLAGKHGLEKVRWGYRFFHSSSAKSGGLVTRGSDFRELQEKAFCEFEEELSVKLDGGEQVAARRRGQQLSAASCVHNALKEILLDFQWDRPDITSPTKLSLRPRGTSRSSKNIPLPDDELSCHGKNVVFVVSACPRSKRELAEFLRCGDGARHRDLHELVLPKRLADTLLQRSVALYWADCSSYKVDNGVEDYIGLKTIKDVLQQVAGKVVPILTTCIVPNDENPTWSTKEEDFLHYFPIGSITGYILSSEKTYQRIFPAVAGSLHWGRDDDRETCSVSFEPVSSRQRLLCDPMEVTLRSVLKDFNTFCLGQSECWMLLCPNQPEEGRAAFHSLLKELCFQSPNMLAEVREGGRIRSAVLSVMSPYTALLTIIEPPNIHSEEVLDTSLISSEVSDESIDLPDVVSSVLNVMYDIMEEEDCSEQTTHIPDWVNTELRQCTHLPTDLTEGWFPLSDQSGISCHLMESMRLLHAAPDDEEQREEDASLELTNSLAELYQSRKDGSRTGPKGKKKGAQRTPVRQKMKTMSRSLQMLNVARFNAKAQKSQAETDSSNNTKETEKRGKRCSGERAKAGPSSFGTEEEFLSYLKLKYQQSVEDRSTSLNSQVQDLLSVVQTFITSTNNSVAAMLGLIKEHLLKTTQSVRKHYASSEDAENKIRDSQLQVFLRLELCRQSSSNPDPDYVEQLVEEMAGMLRIISLTNDPVYLSKFMQEEILPLYVNSIPMVLADIYHSLGTQLPEALAAVLPSDFFSDDSMAKESVPSSLSATQSAVSSVGDRLEELRNRSAKKRRSSMLTRHKSMTEVPQTFRQIEMPRKTTRRTKPNICVPSEKLGVDNLPPQKQAVQEVTKVRRNLFNQETMSPSKKVKMPRSQSVSAVEGMKKRKRSQMEDERHSLLTKKVSETPLHKQVSNRLLHRQRRGRRSDEIDMTIVEESPLKPAADLRRSPRIKNLTRRHSSVFYSSSQPRSRNLDRALSSSQLPASEGKGSIDVKAVKSPMRLLFGAAQSPRRPTTSLCGNRNIEVGSTDAAFENCNKTSRKSPYKQCGASAVGGRTPRTPGSSHKAQSSSFPSSPGVAFGENGMLLRGSPFRSPAAKSLVLETPNKSPLKGILRTPVKSCGTPFASCLSPSMKTPKKSVTWSPSPRKHLPEKPFKVMESPQNPKRYSPRLLTPSKLCTSQANDFKTPEKLPLRRCKVSPELAKGMSKTTATVGFEECELGQRLEKRKALNFPANVDPLSPDILSLDHTSPPTPEVKTPKKSPEAINRMCTRSQMTPLKCASAQPPPDSKDMATDDKLSKPHLRSHSFGNQTSVSNSHLKPLSNQNVSNQMLHEESSTTKTDDGHNESAQGMTGEVSSSDTHQFDSSQVSTTTTEESIDITEATIVKTELTSGIKMSFSFSRKSSKASEVFQFTGAQAPPADATTQVHSYGFRQTPDRQQRKAAARLQYSPMLPMFSTPQSSGRSVCGKQAAQTNPLTYQVELEMQSSGLPKLKIKRTDSFSCVVPDCADKGLAPHTMNAKAPKVDSPVSHCSKHREPGCISPSYCTYGTPGKGGVQTYICQSVTPTRVPTCSASPMGSGEHMPWTPSPQRRGWTATEHLNSWPRKKRARTEMLGTNQNNVKGEVDILEDPELDGVFRLQGVEELKESKTASACKYKLSRRSRLCPTEEVDCSESETQRCDKRDAVKCEEASWKSGKGSLCIVDTPPNSKVKKPVSASGILALTQSPLLFKGKGATVTKETTQYDELSGKSPLYGRKGEFQGDASPFSQPQRRQACGRTYSRKRLLDS